MEKTVQRIYTINITTTSVPIPGTDEFVLVYSKSDGAPDSYVIMRREDYIYAQFPEDIKSFEFFMPHLPDTYPSRYTAMTREQYEAVKAGIHDWYDAKKYREWKLEYGAPLAEDDIVLGYCYGDYSMTYLDGTYVNKTIVDTYLNKNYDIYAIVENERNNPDVTIFQERSWHTEKDNPIYHVHGNGHTLGLGLRISDELYAAYKKCSFWERHAFLDEHTILGNYKRPERNYDISNYDDD